MNVERTMEFILQMQAKAEVRMEGFDKRLDATRKLVETGMKLVLKMEKDRIASNKDFDRRMRELVEAQNELVEAQKKTDQKLDRLIDFGSRRTNGRH